MNRRFFSILRALPLLLIVAITDPAAAVDRTFTGTYRLTAETYFQYDSIVFEDGAVIVTNGFRLTVEGTKSIVIKGTPRIISYEPRAMAPGESGRSAGLVILKTPNLQGTTLIIENSGENGATGAAGSPGPKGSKGPQGTQRDWNAWNGCIGGSGGGPGGPGGDGGDGGQGGSGGAGGAVLLDIGSGCINGGVSRLDLRVQGGSAGQGGTAGSAGPGGDGGDGAPGTFYCGGTGPGPSGAAGRTGRTGPGGAPGNPGPVFDVRQTCSPKPPAPAPGSLAFEKKLQPLKNPK